MQYLLFSTLCLLLFATAAVLGISTTVEWSDILSETESREILNSVGLVGDVETIRDSITATIVSGFFCAHRDAN